MVRFPLHRDRVLFLIIFVLVLALTGINNYFFYHNKDVAEARDVSQFARVFAAAYESCLSAGLPSGDCLEQLKRTMVHSGVAGTARILSSDREPVFEVDNEYYKDDRSLVRGEYAIGNDKDRWIIEVTKLSSPSVLVSVWRSISFSALDIVEKLKRDEPMESFLVHVVVPRSMPFFFFLMVAGLVCILVRQQVRVMFNAWESGQERISALSIELEEKSAAAEKKELEVSELNRRLGQNKEEIVALLAALEREQSRLDQLNRQVVDSESEIASVKKQRREVEELIRRIQANKSKADELNRVLFAQHKQLELERCESASELKKLRQDLTAVQGQENALNLEKNPLVQATEKRVVEVLLTNPDVKPSVARHNTNSGKHHSKDFVQSLIASVERNKRLHNSFLSITAIRYSPATRGKAELLFDNDKKSFVVNVYSRCDEGFGAQVVLSARKQWEAVVQAKCLVTAVSLLKGTKLMIGDLPKQAERRLEEGASGAEIVDSVT